MKKFLKWTLLVVVVLAVCALRGVSVFHSAVLHRRARGVQQGDGGGGAAASADIADPAERAIAERGRYIVMTTGCIGCHATNGPQGPDLDEVPGGRRRSRVRRTQATYVSRNLTPDKETGLGRRSDDEVKRVLRSGVFPDGHVVPATNMPWAAFSNWTEEDRHAVVVYLRHIPAIRNQTPEPVPGNAVTVPGAFDEEHAWKNYGTGRAHAREIVSTAWLKRSTGRAAAVVGCGSRFSAGCS